MTIIPIRAVTFDFWDTLAIADSDEPGRAERGLSPKLEARRSLVHECLNRSEPISRECVDVAYDTAAVAFDKVWESMGTTWTVRERLGVILKGLGRSLPSEEMDELVRAYEEMTLEVTPDFAPNLKECLAVLREEYRLGIIADTIFTSGRAVRKLLDSEGLTEFFEALIFSDEMGCSKPDPRIFRAAAVAMDVDVEEMVHVGDHERRDIEGARAYGARTVLCTVVKDRGSRNTQANAICSDFRKLPAIVEALKTM